MNEKETIIAALCAFINQRSGMDPRNYGDGLEGWRAYRTESRSVTRDLHDARELLRSVELRDSISAEDLKAAFRAFSGRLRLIDKSARYDDGSSYWVYGVDYCTGQYFPTEYRKAVAAVCASALWNRKRADMPPVESYGVTCNDDDNGPRVNATSKRWATRAEAEAYAATVSQSRYPMVNEYHAGKSPGDWLRDSFRREYGPRLAARYFN